MRILKDMDSTWTVVPSGEVSAWYLRLPSRDQGIVDEMTTLLAAQGNQLRMPHSRSLGGGLFELRFTLQRGAIDQRITYIFDPGRRIIELTTFRKTRDNETGQIARARQAKTHHDKETI